MTLGFDECLFDLIVMWGHIRTRTSRIEDDIQCALLSIKIYIASPEFSPCERYLCFHYLTWAQHHTVKRLLLSNYYL